jgi:divalent metal cation (Fe/Co/Zn/Cd) transporter
MKAIIYILLGIFSMLQPHPIFATVGHPMALHQETVGTKHAQKSKEVAKQKAQHSRSSGVNTFFVFAALSLLSFIIGLILLNWWLIILGAIGISLIILFIYLLLHMAWR